MCQVKHVIDFGTEGASHMTSLRSLPLFISDGCILGLNIVELNHIIMFEGAGSIWGISHGYE